MVMMLHFLALKCIPHYVVYPDLLGIVTDPGWSRWIGRLSNHLWRGVLLFPGSTTDGRSLMNSKNDNGPSTVPCRTPEWTWAWSEVLPSRITAYMCGHSGMLQSTGPRLRGYHISGACWVVGHGGLCQMPWQNPGRQRRLEILPGPSESTSPVWL